VIWIALFVLVAGPVHECAHAFTAWRLGDSTAKMYGRVSLDPIRHFDPVGGTLLIVSVLFSAATGSPYGFGWAKPTPVNPYALRGRYGNAKVAAAGPLSNLVLAAAFAVAFRIFDQNGIFPGNTSVPEMGALICWTGVYLNVFLMIFNLIPIAPLDGSHVLLDLLDPATSRRVGAFMDQYSLVILLAVIFVGVRFILPIGYPIISFLTGVQVG
jgi:Zn-dependent protease